MGVRACGALYDDALLLLWGRGSSRSRSRIIVEGFEGIELAVEAYVVGGEACACVGGVDGEGEGAHLVL